MTLSQIAAIADLLAAAGVIASLIFVGYEMRRSSEQARVANWHSVLSALREQKRRTDDPVVADVLHRGRQDFDALSDSEKIMFGYWMEEWLQAQEGLIVFRHVSAHSPEDLLRGARTNLRHMFANPGCLKWWRDSGLANRWPPNLVKEVEAAIEAVEAAET